jgi:hypothetical protein
MTLAPTPKVTVALAESLGVDRQAVDTTVRCATPHRPPAHGDARA